MAHEKEINDRVELEKNCITRDSPAESICHTLDMRGGVTLLIG